MGQNDINKNIHQVAITVDHLDDGPKPVPCGNAGADVIGFAQVMYEPEDPAAQSPAKPTKSQDVSGSNYCISSARIVYTKRTTLSKQRGLT